MSHHPLIRVHPTVPGDPSRYTASHRGRVLTEDAPTAGAAFRSALVVANSAALSECACVERGDWLTRIEQPVTA